LVLKVRVLALGFAVAAGCFTFKGVELFDVGVLQPGTVTGRSAPCAVVVVSVVDAINASAIVATFAVLNIIEFLFPFNRSRRLTSDIKYYSVDLTDFIGNSGRYLLKNFIGNARPIGGHGVFT
jgi:hypothetical protein